MSNPNPSPDLFERLSRGMRVAYKVVAASLDDVKRMDDIERASAEMTTYALALARAAEEHGMPVHGVVTMVVTALNELREAKGQPAIQLLCPPTGKPS